VHFVALVGVAQPAETLARRRSFVRIGYSKRSIRLGGASLFPEITVEPLYQRGYVP
jgi:hypothetical protein